MTSWIRLSVVLLTFCLTAESQPIWVRLQTSVASTEKDPSAPLSAVVIAPYRNAQGLAVPSGSVLSGRLEADGRSKLRMLFDKIRVNGTTYPLQARVVEVDNARERILEDGTVVALAPIRRKPGKVELILLAAAHAHPATLAFVEGTKLTLREVERPAVHYSQGTDIALDLEVPPKLPASPAPKPPARTPPPELNSLLITLVQRTETFHGQKPADWINIAMAGTRETVSAAFTGAGWKLADHQSMTADVKVFLALAEHHAYQHAPVSRLAIAGKVPDMVYQKQTNTFAKRHHIRMWMTDQQWKGQPIWIAAATHDIAIDFSPANKTFIHRIESDIDKERQRILDDLIFAGSVREHYLVQRRGIPAESHNATGDLVTTDGALLFLAF